jgi:hypothetical protein
MCGKSRFDLSSMYVTTSAVRSRPAVAVDLGVSRRRLLAGLEVTRDAAGKSA